MKEVFLQNWLVGWWFWVKRSFEIVFQSISGRLLERGRKRTDDSKYVQTTPTPTYCKHNKPLPYLHAGAVMTTDVLSLYKLS